jgi:tripartite-type tricarboxylate transporter receptor subunit TctC
MQRSTVLLLAGVFVAMISAGAHAAEEARGWPQRPVRLVVPFAPGGTTDIIARQYVEFLRTRLGQPVVVENRGGASTNLGAEVVARAEPDGTTLLLGAGMLASNPVWGPKPGFDPLTAFDSISLVTETSYVFAAGPRFAARAPQEMIALARREPRWHTIATAQLDVVVAQLTRALGIELEHVGYRGGAPAMTDAMAGQVDMVMALVPVLLPSLREGSLTAVAVTGPQRSPVLPAVPSFREGGYPEAVQTSWNGVFAPAGTPHAAIARLAMESRAFVEDPEISARLRDMGIEPRASTPQELAQLLREEMQRHIETADALGAAMPAQSPR